MNGRRRAAGLLLAGAVVLFAGPTSGAQESGEEEAGGSRGSIDDGPWAGSGFDDPDGDPETVSLRNSTASAPWVVTDRQLPVTGHFQHASPDVNFDEPPTVRLAEGDVGGPGAGPAPDRSADSGEGEVCARRGATLEALEAQPDEEDANRINHPFRLGHTTPAENSGEESGNEESDQVEGEQDEPEFVAGLDFPCNGRFEISVPASIPLLGQGASLTGVVVVAAPAIPVTAVAARGSAEDTEIEVAFQVPESAAADTVYRILRTGPEDEAPTPVAEGPCRKTFTPDDAETPDGADHALVRCTDEVEADGVYRYAVRALRPYATPVDTGADGHAQTRVGPAPTTTSSTTTTTRRTVPRSPTTGVSSATTVVASTQTTVDTGFEEELPYEFETPEPGEEAAEGQAVIVDEGDGNGALLPAAAGGSVLLVWAGHLLYLRRLASQF